MKQHKDLRSVLRGFGSEVVEMEELASHPNSVFTRDMAVSTPKGYIKLRMGIETRLGEEEWMAQWLSELGEPCVGEIKEPGTVEGGDVIIAGSIALVGLTERTNPEGIHQLTEILNTMGYEVRPVSLSSLYLHLDQVIGVLGPGRLIYCDGLFPGGFFNGFETIAVTCTRFNVNFICLGENEILAPSSNLAVIEKAGEAGVRVHEVDLSEFAKGAGGPNCLVMPVDRG
jgi:dimethylargininase